MANKKKTIEMNPKRRFPPVLPVVPVAVASIVTVSPGAAESSLTIAEAPSITAASGFPALS
jgi:hypothetical protein